jgi:hypothetical protein
MRDTKFIWEKDNERMKAAGIQWHYPVALGLHQTGGEGQDRNRDHYEQRQRDPERIFRALEF